VASTSKNHERAPKSAAFVSAMREAFGEVAVLYVKENDVLLGEKQQEGAPCFTFSVPEQPKKRKKE
jgi:hypothetical protein